MHQQLWGYKVEEKIYLRVRERRRLNITAVYYLPNIIGVIKSRRMRWAGHVVRMGERRGACRYTLETLFQVHKCKYAV